MKQTAQHAFGTWLKQQRKARRLTQDDLAELLSCSSVLVQKIEAGERTASAQLTVLIGEWLGIPGDQRALFLEFARGQLEVKEAEHNFGYGSAGVTHAPDPGNTHNLPTPLTPLIGRAEAIETIRSILLCDGPRLLTLTSPPGISKTRFALSELGTCNLSCDV